MASIFDLLAAKPSQHECLLACGAAKAVPPAPAYDVTTVGTPTTNISQGTTIKSMDKAGSRKRDRRAAKAQPNTKVLPDFVPQVRALTQGKTLLIVGDLCTKAERQRIEKLLQCRVVWWEAQKREKLAPMKAAGAKCDLLVSIIRDASHPHTKGLIALSRETGIPVVNVPKGANENIIAYQISRQILRAS